MNWTENWVLWTFAQLIAQLDDFCHCTFESIIYFTPQMTEKESFFHLIVDYGKFCDIFAAATLKEDSLIQ